MQRYVSDELTHFVGRAKKNRPDEQFRLLLKIIRSGTICWPVVDPEFWGNMYNVRLPVDRPNEPPTIGFTMACFCDIPVADLGLHRAKYSDFGLAFKRQFLVQRGAKPVLYVPEDGQIRWGPSMKPVGPTFKMMKRYVVDFLNDLRKRPDLRLNDLEGVQTFVVLHLLGYIKEFNSSLSDDADENYYMEREWRVVGGVQFTLEDISRIIVPKDYAKRFRDEVPEYYGQVSFVD